MVDNEEISVMEFSLPKINSTDFLYPQDNNKRVALHNLLVRCIGKLASALTGIRYKNDVFTLNAGGQLFQIDQTRSKKSTYNHTDRNNIRIFHEAVYPYMRFFSWNVFVLHNLQRKKHYLWNLVKCIHPYNANRTHSPSRCSRSSRVNVTFLNGGL